MSHLNRVVKNTGFLYFRMAITVLISLYSTRLTLSALGVTDFGLFNMVAGVISMLSFLNSAMAAATQRFMSFAEGAGDIYKLKEIFNISLALHIIIAVFVFLILEILGFYLLDRVLNIPVDRLDAAKIIMQFMIVSTVFTITSVPYEAVLISHENMFFVAILGILEAIIKLGIAIYLSYTSFDSLNTYGFLMALLSVFMLLIKRIYCHSKYSECKINFFKYIKKGPFKEISNFALWSLLSYSTSIITNYGQGIILNIFFGPIVNAAQAISNQINGQLSVFAGNMLKALNPIITKSEGAGNRDLMLNMSLVGTKLSFFLLVICFIPVILDMDFIFSFWLKEVPKFSVVFCKLLLFKSLIEQFYITLANSIKAVGNIRAFQISRSILNVFPLLFSYLAFKLGAEPYAMYLIFVSYAIMDGFITLYFAKKHCQLSYKVFINKVLAPCLIIAMVAFTVAFIPSCLFREGAMRLILICLASTIATLLGVWYFGLEILEKKPIYKLVNRFTLNFKSRLIRK